MRSVRKPWWQQATALVTVSAGGVITGLNFVPGAAATMNSPTSVPLHLLALEQAAQSPGTLGGDSAGTAASDERLREAVVNVAKYYLRLAQTRTPAQMEALIWDKTSSDGADHGPSCAAFASLTLELGAQAVGQQSWVSGGSSYPWPLPEWADVRVDTNPASPAITSMVADAQAHGRWHPLGDGYQPRPGDWVLFNGHVEVVASYADGVLGTIGADSLPGLTVNAHSLGAPLAGQGVEGFVDNGNLKPASSAVASPAPAGGQDEAGHGSTALAGAPSSRTQVAIPGVLAAGAFSGAAASDGTGAIPGTAATSVSGTATRPHSGSATIPGTIPAPETLFIASGTSTGTGAGTPGTEPAAPEAKPGGTAAAAPAATPTPASAPARQYATPATRDQQAFISLVAPGAVAAQQRYGVPAAVTIAQAIEESAWGRSGLAAQYHNLFGIKGTGPAGSVTLPTSEYLGGHWVTVDAQFRVYHNDSESIADHAELLATSGYYTRAMADRAVPDAFANDLTGVYATDPEYGANLIALMKLYNLYRFDTGSQAQPTAPATPVVTPTATPTPSASTAGHPSVAPTTSRGSHSATDTAGYPGAGHAIARGSARAQVPGVAAPALAPAMPSVTDASSLAPGGQGAARIPGMLTPGSLAASASPTASSAAARPTPRPATPSGHANARIPGVVTSAAVRYQKQFPPAVATAFFATAKAPLARGEHLYRDVASQTGIRWELLAAVDWMQCNADPRYSPVHGEKIGSLNTDGTSYSTKSAALAQCARDLVQLAGAVYAIDLIGTRALSVRALADAFAAFRWGALLRRHGVSAMEFPYSVAGLTTQHQKMHWPGIDAPGAPDRPGARFREPFGAVPVVLSLDYPATV